MYSIKTKSNMVCVEDIRPPAPPAPTASLHERVRRWLKKSPGPNGRYEGYRPDPSNPLRAIHENTGQVMTFTWEEVFSSSSQVITFTWEEEKEYGEEFYS